jgi:hypothetical protein
VQLGSEPGIALGDLVVGPGQLQQHAVAGLRQPSAELAVAHVLQRRQQPSYRDLVNRSSHRHYTSTTRGMIIGRRR